jgi:hypothetical protein
MIISNENSYYYNQMIRNEQFCLSLKMYPYGTYLKNVGSPRITLLVQEPTDLKHWKCVKNNERNIQCNGRRND